MLSERWVSTKGTAGDSSLNSLGAAAELQGASGILEFKGKVIQSRLDGGAFYMIYIRGHYYLFLILLLENATWMRFFLLCSTVSFFLYCCFITC